MTQAPGDSTETAQPIEDMQSSLHWPTCPACGQRRLTCCPTCEVGGDNFELAEFIPASETLPVNASGCCGGGCKTPEVDPTDFGVLLMCPSCDEAFAPKYYRQCERCGFDYGSGIEISVAEREKISQRATWVLAAITIGGILLLGYFWWLIR